MATVDSLVQKFSLQFPGEVPVYRQPFYLDGRNFFFFFKGSELDEITQGDMFVGLSMDRRIIQQGGVRKKEEVKK